MEGFGHSETGYTQPSGPETPEKDDISRGPLGLQMGSRAEQGCSESTTALRELETLDSRRAVTHGAEDTQSQDLELPVTFPVSVCRRTLQSYCATSPQHCPLGS